MAPTVGRHDWDAGLLGGIGTVTEYLPLARQGGGERNASPRRAQLFVPPTAGHRGTDLHQSGIKLPGPR